MTNHFFALVLFNYHCDTDHRKYILHVLFPHCPLQHHSSNAFIRCVEIFVVQMFETVHGKGKKLVTIIAFSFCCYSLSCYSFAKETMMF